MTGVGVAGRSRSHPKLALGGQDTHLPPLEVRVDRAQFAFDLRELSALLEHVERTMRQYRRRSRMRHRDCASLRVVGDDPAGPGRDAARIDRGSSERATDLTGARVASENGEGHVADPTAQLPSGGSSIRPAEDTVSIASLCRVRRSSQ